MYSLDEVIESYKRYLKKQYPIHHQAFCNREQANPESARAEAAVFAMLRMERIDVSIFEKPSSGGADFLCTSLDGSFLVEVSSLTKESVTEQPGLSHVPAESCSSFGFLTHMIRTRASKKAPQLSTVQMPRLLAVTTEHEWGAALLGTLAAEATLVGNLKIGFTQNSSDPELKSMTELEEAAFFRFTHEGTVEACRQSISGLLLIHILADECMVLGILHPEPRFKFAIQHLSQIPFLRVCCWPPVQGRIEIEWVIGHPQPISVMHWIIDE
ncbi:MAG: hypothetical protein FJY97_01550 [candidate division Zixibacteria bacterium]|nr:hypothetical protein [candidate division Zixibacteria bacterium]